MANLIQRAWCCFKKIAQAENSALSKTGQPNRFSSFPGMWVGNSCFPGELSKLRPMGSHQLMDAGCKNAAGKNNKNIPLYKDMKGKEKTAENTDMKIRGGDTNIHCGLSCGAFLWAVLRKVLWSILVQHSYEVVLWCNRLP